MALYSTDFSDYILSTELNDKDRERLKKDLDSISFGIIKRCFRTKEYVFRDIVNDVVKNVK